MKITLILLIVFVLGMLTNEMWHLYDEWNGKTLSVAGGAYKVRSDVDTPRIETKTAYSCPCSWPIPTWIVWKKNGIGEYALYHKMIDGPLSWDGDSSDIRDVGFLAYTFEGGKRMGYFRSVDTCQLKNLLYKYLQYHSQKDFK